MKVKVGAVFVLVATFALLAATNLEHFDPVGETRRQIIAVIVGLTAYAVVLLGVLDTPPKEKWVAAVIAAVLLLPTSLIGLFGAYLISLGWRDQGVDDRISVLCILLTYAVAGAVYVVGSWMRRRRG